MFGLGRKSKYYLKNIYRNDNVTYYGINPPAMAKPLWGNGDGIPQEDLIINAIDTQISLQKLQKEEKEVIELISQGYSEREIADLRKVSQPRIHKIKENAFRHLRELLSTGLSATELQTA